MTLPEPGISIGPAFGRLAEAVDRELLAGSLGEPLMPFSAVLTTEEREALVEVTRFGFPSRSWFDVERVAASYSMVRSLSSTT